MLNPTHISIPYFVPSNEDYPQPFHTPESKTDTLESRDRKPCSIVCSSVTLTAVETTMTEVDKAKLLPLNKPAREKAASITTEANKKPLSAKEEKVFIDEFRQYCHSTQGSEEKARHLLAYLCKHIDPDLDEGSLINIAASAGNVAMVELLLDKGVQNNLFSALEGAAYHGHAQCTAKLIDHLYCNGVDVREIQDYSAYSNHKDIQALIDQKLHFYYKDQASIY
jgi:hypothetical protein